MPETVQQLMAMIEQAVKNQDRLILVVGQPGSGKSKLLRELATLEGWRLISCRELISEELLELVPEERQREAPNLIGEMLAHNDARVILLDNVDVLFTPVLRLKPLELLRQLSERQVIVAAWPGTYDGNRLEFIHSLAQRSYSFTPDNLTIIKIG